MSSDDEELERLRRRVAELEARQRHYELLRVAFHGSPVAMAITRLGDGRIAEANEACLRLFGWTRQEVIGHTSTELGMWVHPGARGEFIAALQRQGALHDRAATVRTRSGELRHVVGAIELVHYEGEPALLGMMLDLTERRAEEEARRRADSRFAQLFHVAPVALDLFRLADGRLVDVNDAWVDLFGHPREEALGRTESELGLWDDPATRQVLIQRLTEERTLRDIEAPLRHRDGQLRQALVSLELVDLDDGPSVIKAALDITDRKRAEAEVARQAEELLRSNADLEQFAFLASHDLQEPLRMVASYTELLTRRYSGRLDDEADEMLRFARDGALRGQQLIRDLLTYSQLTTAPADFRPTALDQVVARALRQLRVAVQERGAVVTWAELPTVSGDPGQLLLLFQNLLGNALKFCGEAPPRVEITAAREDATVRVSVRDHGIGIPPDQRERIFVLFHRGHDRARYPGSGIGLALCRRIVERHGGRLWAEPHSDGTTFHFTIPDPR